MANVTLKGNPFTTKGELPKIGSKLSDFEFTNKDLSRVKLSDFKGNKLILNIFPSIDTGTCATSVRTFNQKASVLEKQKYCAFPETYLLLKKDFVVLKELKM